MASSRPPPPKSLDLELTIVSAKHLKNVNWKNGDLKAYAVFWVDPDRRLSTKSDDSGSTRPVWNERFTSLFFSLPRILISPSRSSTPNPAKPQTPRRHPPSPPRPIFDRTGSYGGPSAPVEYSLYDQRQKGGGKMGFGTGLAVGAVAGALGGLALEEGLKYEEEKIAERVENDLTGRDDYSDYRADY
ncbi:hypothetical protein GH714_036969 [Hevea brasiliensis]|uniref:C2 domain-containing protein n=1 Tax=Hevea brasiliensis TaxID=3981 RepID=A0A6A6L5G2_HEVBR|nr:hypothetical protein GH714_036969 [Hevea brasiliensis]